MSRVHRVGVVGARGHVGGQLLPMLQRHPYLELAWVTSSRAAGEPVEAAPGLRYEAADPSLLQSAGKQVDALILALPNGYSEPWVRAAGDAAVVDLSTDHRFDAAWVYGQPERFRAQIRASRRIAGPGCYATAAQLAIAPIAELVRGSAHAFGVSGYSGAGTTPSPRNDPERLADNLLPYALVDHAHERELCHHLPCAVRFAPHVAAFFRGLSVTVSFDLREPCSLEQLKARYQDAYADEPLVQWTEASPEPRAVVGTHRVDVGGLAVARDGSHATVVAALDNLLAGAASHGVRSLNLMLGLDELAGL